MRYEADAIVIADEGRQSVHLTLVGKPVSQPRARARRLNRALIVFDPSAKLKTICRSSFRQALQEIGVTTFPIFDPENHKEVTVVVDFYVANIRKDVDNMLKFVLDVLQTIIYRDDSCVFKVVATKIKTAVAHEKTEIKIEHVMLDQI